MPLSLGLWGVGAELFPIWVCPGVGRVWVLDSWNPRLKCLWVGYRLGRLPLEGARGGRLGSASRSFGSRP